MKVHSADLSFIGLENAMNDIKNHTFIPMTEESIKSAFKKMAEMPENSNGENNL